MATHVIDLSADKNISNASPIAMMAFILCFLITNIVMEVSILYFILVAVEFVLCQVFFQFSPRMVFLTIKFLFMQSDLSPTLDDVEYYGDEYHIPNLKKILVELDDEKKAEKEKEIRALNLKVVKPEVNKNEQRK